MQYAQRLKQIWLESETMMVIASPMEGIAYVEQRWKVQTIPEEALH